MTRRDSDVERVTPGGSYTVTIRADYPNKPGMLGRVASVIGDVGGDIGSIDLVEASRDRMVRDITVSGQDTAHVRAIIDALRRRSMASPSAAPPTASSSPTSAARSRSTTASRSRPAATSRRVYTPGVARVSQAIYDDPEVAWTLTMKRNTVAIVTDGSAVLGLGDIGPAAALPVMEGKAMLFKEFADVDAWPLCLDTKDVDEIVQTVKAIAPGFGGINLEDISAPRCFEIEERLRKELEHPRLPRRPARHRRRRPGRPDQRDAHRRQDDGGHSRLHLAASAPRAPRSRGCCGRPV